KFTGDVLFSTGFMGRLWLVRYELYNIDAGVEYVVNRNVLAVWMEPRFNEYGKIVASWEVDDNPDDGLGVTERMVKTLRPHIKFSFVDEQPSSYTLRAKTIYDKSRASRLFGAGIAVGALIVALAGTNPAIAAAAPIASLLSIGIEVGMYTEKLYETLGYFRVELSDTWRGMYIKGYYANFTNTYMVSGESVERAVPLMFLRPT
ncbi:MAG: hypothetical protein ACK4H7_00670, partial [Acidilobaceae archaeon]